MYMLFRILHAVIANIIIKQLLFEFAKRRKRRKEGEKKVKRNQNKYHAVIAFYKTHVILTC